MIVDIDIVLKASTSLSAVMRWGVGAMVFGEMGAVYDYEMASEKGRSVESQDDPSRKSSYYIVADQTFAMIVTGLAGKARLAGWVRASGCRLAGLDS